MPHRMPLSAYVLGFGGVLPFIGCGIAAVSGNQPSLGLPALMAYGAVILSFVGAVHWGFALQASPMFGAAARSGSVTQRLALGVIPALIGWAALVVSLVRPEPGLALEIVGFIGTVVVEARWARQGLLPPGYMTLRWALSVVVVMTLVTVLALRLLGATIML